MKTIAVTIDEAMLAKIDGLVGSGGSSWSSRSAFVRVAAQDFLARLERRAEEERERRIFHQSRDRLEKQAEALVREQAEL